jgi:hypothetical protein
MDFIKERIIKFTEEYNCKESIETIYPNIYNNQQLNTTELIIENNKQIFTINK